LLAARRVLKLNLAPLLRDGMLEFDFVAVGRNVTLTPLCTTDRQSGAEHSQLGLGERHFDFVQNLVARSDAQLVSGQGARNDSDRAGQFDHAIEKMIQTVRVDAFPKGP
jgi:hypothetical protein